MIRFVTTLIMLLWAFVVDAQFNAANSQFAGVTPNPQTMASFVDAAVGFNAWVLGNNENSFKRIGAYKVRGTPYLFAAAYKGDVYAGNQQGMKVVIGYDTYQQQLEIYLGGPDPIIKQVSEVDSFYLRADSSTYFKKDMFFVNALRYDSTRSFFLMQLMRGNRFSLFKAYRTELGIVTENYVQAELRQFDLKYDFYYFDAQKGRLEKMKLTNKYLKNQFREIIDMDNLLNLEELNRNPEAELQKIFAFLNSK